MIDREIAHRIGGPFFNFQPYHYGPFDVAVYQHLEELEASKHVAVDDSGRYGCYFLTESGYERGVAILGRLEEVVATYSGRVARWVRFMPYRRMLAAIYRRYPETAVNSVVGHLAHEPALPARDTRHPLVRGMGRAFNFRGTPCRDAARSTDPDADAKAIYGDWLAVGEYMENAMVRLGKSEKLW